MPLPHNFEKSYPTHPDPQASSRHTYMEERKVREGMGVKAREEEREREIRVARVTFSVRHIRRCSIKYMPESMFSLQLNPLA